MVTKIGSGRSNKKSNLVSFVCVQFGLYAANDEKATSDQVLGLLEYRNYALSDLPNKQSTDIEYLVKDGKQVRRKSKVRFNN